MIILLFVFIEVDFELLEDILGGRGVVEAFPT